MKYAKRGLWNRLSLFWTAEKVNSWKKVVLGQNGNLPTEKVQNLIPISSSVHTYRNRRHYVLKPLELHDDHETLEVWWLPMKKARGQPYTVLVETKPGHTTTFDSPGNSIALSYYGDEKEVLVEIFCSGLLGIRAS